MQTTLINPASQNRKLGDGVAVTYRPVGDSANGTGTCPSNCPLLPEKSGACYTTSFLVNRIQRMSRERDDPISKLDKNKTGFVRFNVSGDIFRQTDIGFDLDREHLDEIIDWCVRNPKTTAWLYTHNIGLLIAHSYTYVNESFPPNLHIIASVESLDEREYAKSFGFRTSRVIQTEDAKIKGEAFCPYDLHLSRQGSRRKGDPPRITCATCKLCFSEKHKKDIVFMQQ